MNRLHSLLVLLTFFLLLFVPVFVQVTASLFVAPRVLVSIPLVLLVLVICLDFGKYNYDNLDVMLFSLLIFIFLFGFYYGIKRSDTNLIGVLAYARSYWIFILFFFLGYTSTRLGIFKTIKYIYFYYVMFTLLFLFFEVFGEADAALLLGYNKFNAITPEVWIDSHTKPFFNLKSLSSYQVYRPEGPTGSTISYAYSLLAFPLLFKPYTKKFYLSLFLLFCVSVFLGSKGAFILICSTLLIAVFVRLKNDINLIFVFLVILSFTISYIQVVTNDNHGLGFLGGLNNLLSFPFGQGLGVGGNLAGPAFNSEDGQRSFIYGSESIYGVFFTQIGFLFFILLFFLFRMIRRNIGSLKASIVSGLCFLILLFGMSQEEAWSTMAAIPFLFIGHMAFIKKKEQSNLN